MFWRVTQVFWTSCSNKSCLFCLSSLESTRYSCGIHCFTPISASHRECSLDVLSTRIFHPLLASGIQAQKDQGIPDSVEQFMEAIWVAYVNSKVFQGVFWWSWQVWWMDISSGYPFERLMGLICICRNESVFDVFFFFLSFSLSPSLSFSLYVYIIGLLRENMYTPEIYHR